MKERKRKDIKRDLILLGITLTILVILLAIFPEKFDRVTDISCKFFIEMIWILPAVMILIGLFAVWVSKEMVVKYIGKASGIKGISFALIFGALPTGPLYIAFPMAQALIKKGASISNIVIFLSAWACIKIPQEIVELQFLGIKFMLSRLILTIIFVILMGIIIEKII
ncbi:hypothetical protein DRQ09_10600, partial [candidate division KSB1 bacterium]